MAAPLPRELQCLQFSCALQIQPVPETELLQQPASVTEEKTPARIVWNQGRIDVLNGPSRAFNYYIIPRKYLSEYVLGREIVEAFF